MDALQTREWTRYGKHRLYVNAPDGATVGWVDLTTGQQHLEVPQLSLRFAAAVADWHRAAGRALPAPRLPSTAPDGGDLAENRAGAAARKQARMLRAERPVRTFLARLMGVHTDERSWRIGADGEESVGRILAGLSDQWRVLHAVPVGERGSDIDHVVIGPGGVYTINTKTHLGGNIWVAGNQFRINNQPVPYLRNSRFEAERAARLLSTAARQPVDVYALIAVVGAHRVTIREEPEGAVVLADRELRPYLQSEPLVLSPEEIERIYSIARHTQTWTP